MTVIFRSVLAKEMNDYLNLLQSAQRDIESYISTFRSLDEYMYAAMAPEKELSGSLLMDWIASLSVADTTKNYEIARVRKFARYLEAIGIPAYEPDFRRASSAYKAYTFSDEEFKGIIRIADSGGVCYTKAESSIVFPALLRVLYGSGLRIGEALSLQWKNVDLDGGIITIMKAKNNRQRLVPISNSLKDLLVRYRKRRFSDGDEAAFLFPNSEKEGRPYSKQTFAYWFSKVLEKSGIENRRMAPFERCISPHTLRHYFTFKSFQKAVTEGRALEETAPYLSAYLGHESFYGTERYITTDYTMYTDSQEKVAIAIQSLFPEVFFE